LISLVGPAAPMPSMNAEHSYRWKLIDADSWLREQPLLGDQ
jgi:hypothetical protein